jgi:hypothetical protein
MSFQNMDLKKNGEKYGNILHVYNRFTRLIALYLISATRILEQKFNKSFHKG